MIRNIFTVSGWTLITRITGFMRDIFLAAVLGAGPVADAFLIAFKLPNHFRSIFAEGAFNAAFVPVYAQALRFDEATMFSRRINGLLIVSNLVLLALVMVFTQPFVGLLAPGIVQDPTRYPLTVELTRITFPYLLCITLVTLLAAMLNASRKYAIAASSFIVLNLSLIAGMLCAQFFPTAGHAAAWAVLIAGFLQLVYLAYGCKKARLPIRPATFKLERNEKQFLRTLGPAVVGSAATQIAMFADTILASFLPVGSVSAMYYADRLYQLPIGVIAVAAGTVLLTELSRLISAGDHAGAKRQQSRAVAMVLFLAAPAFVAFLVLPDLILMALFQRGAFSAQATQLAADVLGAYAIGLPAMLLIRLVTTPFHARGNTKTPVRIALIAIAVNVGAKIVLTPVLGAPGLALATSFGAWVNLLALGFLAYKRGYIDLDERIGRIALCIAFAALLLAGALFGAPFIPLLKNQSPLLLLIFTLISGGVVYLAAVYGSLRLFVPQAVDWLHYQIQTKLR